MNKLILAAISTLLCGCAAVSHDGSNSDAQTQFERLKKLDGNWITVQEQGSQPAGMKIRYHVIGNGSALVENLFPAGEQEMVTVYQMDGGELVLTHYCSLGNQPHMRADSSSPDGKIEFTCDGGTNFDPAKDTHMHNVEFQLIDETHMRETWTLYEKGHPAEVAPFVLVRTW
jgi:hypothetical protein